MSDITLRLDRWERLVVEAPFDPASPDLPKGPVLDAMARRQAYIKRGPPPTRLVILLEGQPVTAEMQAAATRAVSAYCRQEAAEARELVLRTRRAGWLSMAIAMVLLAASLAMATAVEKFEPLTYLLNRWLSEGLVILGWVVLWRPFDNLLYEWWAPQRMVRTYSRFAELEVVLRPADAGNAP
jgi:hypothetical protein